MAAKLYGGPIAFDIRFGVPRTAFEVTDTGRPHNSGDVLSVMGVKHYAVTAAVLRLIVAYETGLPAAANRTITNDTIADAYRRWPDVAESIAIFQAQRMQGSFRTSPIAATVFFANRIIGPEKAAEFLKLVVTGLTSKQSNPCRRLYDRILREQSEKARMPQIERFAVCLKALNAHVAKTEITNLRWRSSGPAAEPFPVVDGLTL